MKFLLSITDTTPLMSSTQYARRALFLSARHIDYDKKYVTYYNLQSPQSLFKFTRHFKIQKENINTVSVRTTAFLIRNYKRIVLLVNFHIYLRSYVKAFIKHFGKSKKIYLINCFYL